MDIQYEECPQCGNPKHHSILRVDEGGRERRLFKCRACGYKEYDFSEYEEKPDRRDPVIERMGDAFREFLMRRRN